MAGKQRVPLGIVGPSSKAYSEAQIAGRSVNLLTEIVDGRAALRAVEGYFRWADLTSAVPASARIRGFHQMGDRLFVVAANKVVEVTRDPTEATFSSVIELASLATTTGRVGMSDNNGKVVIGDGTGFFVLDLDTHALDPVLDDPGNGEPIRGFYSVYDNGTTLYFERDSSKYWYSELNDPATVLGLSFFSAEFSPDFTVNAYAVNGEIVIPGQETTEFHTNTGDADNPFSRIPGGHIEYGCVGRWASCKFDNSVVMVGRSKEGQGKVYRLGAAGGPPSIISTPAVEKCIEKVLFAFADVTESVTMWSEQNAGHACCVLNLPAVPATVNNPAQPSMTWVYDSSVPAPLNWHERGYMNPATGQFERILSDFHVTWRDATTRAITRTRTSTRWRTTTSGKTPSRW
jgi:hypothetical protein